MGTPQVGASDTTRLPPFWDGLERFALRHFIKTSMALAAVTLAVTFSNAAVLYPELSFWVGLPVLIAGVASFIASPLWKRLRGAMTRQGHAMKRWSEAERLFALFALIVGLTVLTTWTSLFGLLLLVASWSLINHALFFWARRPQMLALKYGVSTHGEVVAVKRDLRRGNPFHVVSQWHITYTYRDGAGQEHEGADLIDPPRDGPPAVGDVVEVMYDPIAPNHSALMTEVNAETAEAVPEYDARRERGPDHRKAWTAASALEAPPEALECVLNSFDPTALEWWELGLPHDSTTVQLELVDGRLRTRVHAEQLLDIDLSEGFVLHLGFWPTSRRDAELSVTIRPRGVEGLGVSSLRFIVLLGQDEVHPSVPLQRSLGPLMLREDFAELWPALVHHGQLHGMRLEREVRVMEREAPDVFSGVGGFGFGAKLDDEAKAPVQEAAEIQDEVILEEVAVEEVVEVKAE